MRISILWCAVTLLFFNLNCDPKKDAPPQTLDLSCIKIFDDQGQGLGLHGGCTSSPDWGKITLDASEQALLNFSDTISLAGTNATDITGIFAFPCPVKIEQAFSVYSGGSVPGQSAKLKIAIVDESLHVVQQLAILTQSGQGLQLYMDPAKYESGKYYRMYYRFSSSGSPSLYEGYGNFLVCKTYIDGVNTTIESDCL